MATLSDEEIESFRGKQMSAGFFTFGKPLKEGWLTKQGGRVKNWKRRWFVLKDNRLYYYKRPNDVNAQGFIPLTRCVVKAAEVKKNCFKIFDPHQPFSKNHPSFYIYADSSEDLNEWMNVLDKNSNPEPIDVCPIIKEGFLSKRGGIVKNWKTRWFTLKGNNLYYYKHKDDGEPLGFIPIERASVQVVPFSRVKKNFCFEITDPSNSFNKWHKSYFIYANNEEEMNAWIEAIVNVKYEADRASSRLSSKSKKASIIIHGYEFEDEEESEQIKESTQYVEKIDKRKVIEEPIQLPTVITKMIRFLDMHEVTISDFTKLNSVCSNEVETLKRAIEEEDNTDKQLEKCSNYLVVAKLLLIYLAETLPEPVCTTNLSKDLLDTCLLERESQLNYISKIIHEKLPKDNFYLLQFLLAFIGRIFEHSEIDVNESNEEIENGQLYSLASIFTPILINTPSQENKEEQKGVSRLVRGLTQVLEQIEFEETQQKEKSGAQSVVQLMILEFDRIFISDS